MPKAKHITRAAAYANREDFCRIFNEDMNSLYLLALLLTADREKAEQCFVSGLEDVAEGNPVFKEWARSWARRMIIQNAVRRINPRPGDGSEGSSSASLDGTDETLPAERHAQVGAVLGLEPFERFVYVMTVLERYSEYECALLLGGARRDVLAARTRALQQLGSAMEMYDRQLANVGAQNLARQERGSSVLELTVARRLATSA
jgi:hypothetical protein